jgi:hypothetical protein
MSDQPSPNPNLSDEFRDLGKNLVNAMKAAWDSPERQKLQKELGDGIDQLITTLRMETDTFRESPAGQRLRADVEDLRQRVRSGEIENQVRSEILTALRTINSELERAAGRWNTPESAEPAPADSPQTPPEGQSS